MNNFRRMPENQNNVNNQNNQNYIANVENNCLSDKLLEALCSQVGRRCSCEFNTQKGIDSKSGILERVGNDYLVLRSLTNNKLMYCYINHLLFITIN